MDDLDEAVRALEAETIRWTQHRQLREALLLLGGVAVATFRNLRETPARNLLAISWGTAALSAWGYL